MQFMGVRTGRTRTQCTEDIAATHVGHGQANTAQPAKETPALEPALAREAKVRQTGREDQGRKGKKAAAMRAEAKGTKRAT